MNIPEILYALNEKDASGVLASHYTRSVAQTLGAVNLDGCVIQVPADRVLVVSSVCLAMTGGAAGSVPRMGFIQLIDDVGGIEQNFKEGHWLDADTNVNTLRQSVSFQEELIIPSLYQLRANTYYAGVGAPGGNTTTLYVTGWLIPQGTLRR